MAKEWLLFIWEVQSQQWQSPQLQQSHEQPQQQSHPSHNDGPSCRFLRGPRRPGPQAVQDRRAKRSRSVLRFDILDEGCFPGAFFFFC